MKKKHYIWLIIHPQDMTHSYIYANGHMHVLPNAIQKWSLHTGLRGLSPPDTASVLSLPSAKFHFNPLVYFA